MVNNGKWKLSRLSTLNYEKNVEKSALSKSYPRYPHKNVCFWGITHPKKRTDVLGRTHKNRILSKDGKKNVDI